MNIPHISLDKTSNVPLYRQLSDALQGLVAEGKLLPDTKLPSIRQLAQALDVNNTTIISAYKYLERKMAVYSVVGSGTYVAKPKSSPEPYGEVPLLPDNIDGYINFADTTTDTTLFPVTAFRRAFDAVLDRDGGRVFDAHDNRGYKPLRDSLCQMIGDVGVKADADCIQVISDTQQGIELIADTLLEPGDTVFVEGPTSQVAVAAFLARDAKIIEMPLVKDGPDMAALEVLLKKHRPKLIYVMPNFQTPTGISYSDESSRRLLSLAYSADAYIIEDDQFSDFYYNGIKRTPLKALDDGCKVFYIKSFAKTLAAGLGMGFIVCPDACALAANTDIGASGYIQRGFDLFLRSGAYELHMANMRSVYGRRYHKLVAAVNTYLGHLADFELPGGGLSLWICPRIVDKNGRDYIEGFLQQKVIVSPGRLFAGAGGDLPGFRISFAAVDDERISEGIGVIASVLGGEPS